MRKSAIILGATGLVGSWLLKKLLCDSRYKTIKLFSRNSTECDSSKIKEFLIDVSNLSKYESDFVADEVFCCIGTTAKKTRDKSMYKAIDYDIPVTAAKLSKENGIRRFIVISSMGANVSSTFFYNKIKGQMERDVLKQQVEQTHILRPSLLGGIREEFRLGESVSKWGMMVLYPLFQGTLKKYRIIHPRKVASCMVILANSRTSQSIFRSDEIENFARSGCI